MKKCILFLCVSLSLSLSLLANPLIVAHRGGTADAPENTIAAIDLALQNKADIIWITVQLSKDGQIVLYRPSDLKALTQGNGLISSLTAKDLKKLEFKLDKYQGKEFERAKVYIPSLDEVLKRYKNTTFFIDIKSPDAPAKLFADKLLSTLKANKALKRVRVYSTDAKFTEALNKQIQLFESRDATRARLANVSLNHSCEVAKSAIYAGFELKRKVQVVEKFTLGEGISESFLSWDKEAVACFKQNKDSKIILFGINSKEDFLKAKELGADGVMVDSPAFFRDLK